MKLHRLLVPVLLMASSASGATIVNMQFVSDVAGSGVFQFTIDGLLSQLFCDQFLPNASTSPYKANVSTLADLSLTVLGLAGDPDALFKYQRVAILELQALGNPSLAVDVVRASRRIVDGQGPLGPGAQTLYDFALAANAANYDLTGFRIYTNITTQELGGFTDFNLNNTPEPAAFVLFGSGLTAIGLWRRRRVNQ